MSSKHSYGAKHGRKYEHASKDSRQQRDQDIAKILDYSGVTPHDLIPARHIPCGLPTDPRDFNDSTLCCMRRMTAALHGDIQQIHKRITEAIKNRTQDDNAPFIDEDFLDARELHVVELAEDDDCLERIDVDENCGAPANAAGNARGDITDRKSPEKMNPGEMHAELGELYHEHDTSHGHDYYFNKQGYVLNRIFCLEEALHAKGRHWYYLRSSMN
jgi:hypothetical protein